MIFEEKASETLTHNFSIMSTFYVKKYIDKAEVVKGIKKDNILDVKPLYYRGTVNC
ncbi:hypothetical protein CYANOKiyG1_50120 [Okeania sp. KiyG1]|nr:hypothetical protein CYANOKiyG1_50120 [Okeania sp. KiyG1]